MSAIKRDPRAARLVSPSRATAIVLLTTVPKATKKMQALTTSLLTTPSGTYPYTPGNNARFDGSMSISIDIPAVLCAVVSHEIRMETQGAMGKEDSGCSCHL